MNGLDDSRTGMSMLSGCLLVSVPGMCSEEMLARLQGDLLASLQGTGIRGVLLDFSAVAVMDSCTFASFARITRMAALMGVASVWTSLTPGVVSALIDLDTDLSGITAARTTEDGLQLLAACRPQSELPEEEDDDGDDPEILSEDGEPSDGND